MGSGYGGSITAARIAAANLNPKPSVCILERGKEWPIGSFPDTIEGYLGETRRDGNPLGLFEMINYQDISVIKGSGLGGTSLVNANVALVPDEETFTAGAWPKGVTLDTLKPFYQEVKKVLDVGPHPNWQNLPKIQALDQRARELGLRANPLNIAVNFTVDGVNPHGVPQKPCIDCGDCVTGCNVGAKNTLYMNYLPMAANAGAEIYTQTKVEWIQPLDGGGWQVHGVWQKSNLKSESFDIEARNVILAAGSINSTEILLRSSNLKGLSLSPALGTRFGGNGDFFGLAYNSDKRTQVLGFGNHPGSAGSQMPPGPTITAGIFYNRSGGLANRFAIEDLSFPTAYVRGAQLAFSALRGEDTDVGDEAEERARITRDALQQTPYHADGALNHTMFYLCMGMDDAGGYFKWDRPFFERDGRVSVSWSGAGRQGLFGMINEELKRHARSLGASFLANPMWAFLNLRRLVTAHPLGGCPMGNDYVEGVVDEFGRVFSGDGSVHTGLFVADGSIIPTALGVNPFMTISALSERIAARKIREMQGDAYPVAAKSVGFAGLDAVAISAKSETELERLFDRAVTLPIDRMMNAGGEPQVDAVTQRISDDTYWKGFFPKGHVLNTMSAALYTGFKKEFKKKGSKFEGITSDTDGAIRARNSLEEVTIKEQTGDLKPGKYILLKYLDPPWQGFYDIFKAVNQDLLIGRVYLGAYPNGIRMFTFPMTRVRSFEQMTIADHRSLYARSEVPTADQLKGSWCMEVLSNANHAVGTAYLSFDVKPGGRLESRYQLMGLIEGLVLPTETADHFQLNDFTPFRDEIRMLDEDLMIGKWIADIPQGAPNLPFASLGIFQNEKTPDGKSRLGFYYLLTRAEGGKAPANPLLSPLLDAQMPRGVGMNFDEEMVGWYFASQPTPEVGRKGDLTIADRIPANGEPAGSVSCKFNVRMLVADLNEFIDGSEHEARVEGTIGFGEFAGIKNATFPIDSSRSRFNYLRVNPLTGEAEMRYLLAFGTPDGTRYSLEGTKYMQKDAALGTPRGPQEVMSDYTTLYTHVYRHDAAGDQELGTGYLKFRTFEDLAAIGNFTGFLRSFRVTGTDDIRLQLMGQLRFLAFTGQFVQTEYDPLALPLAAGGG